MIDRTSTEASHARMDTHEQVCAERYGNINQQLLALHARLNAMSNRMWAAAGGAVGMLIIGIATLVFALLMKGRP